MIQRLLVVGGQLRRAKVEGQLVDLAVEMEGRLIILVVHPGAEVDPDVEGLVDRNPAVLKSPIANSSRCLHLAVMLIFVSASVHTYSVDVTLS